jgi:hypothetical protein
MHIYDGYFDVNKIIASQKFSIKFLLLKIFLFGIFHHRISGIVYIFNFSEGKFGNLLRKYDC